MTHEPADETASPDVFLSCASPDSAVADVICGALECEGIKCWVAPRDVMPGDLYADAIVQALDAAKVVVLVLSRSATTSPHVLREVERATSKRRAIIALRIDAAQLASLEYFLNTSQWLDASRGDVADALPKLIDAVLRHLDRAGATEPRAEAVFPRATSVTRTSRIVAASVAVLSLAVAYFVVDRFWLSRQVASEQRVAEVAPAVGAAATVIAEKSIAVLPFVDMSEAKDQEYFADGMAEEIINLLAKVPDLLVPARTSSFYFKGKPTTIPEIALALGVVHILEGSIRSSGNRLRVTAQLVRADNGYHLWSETYDRDLHDVFKVQDEIANAVVQALQIKLMGGELSRKKGGTQNLEAYQLYLRAWNVMDANTSSSLDAAEEYLNQALKLDPNYGMAWSLLANVIVLKADNGFIPNRAEGYERGRQLTQHALRLSPDLADAHGNLLYIHITLDRDWAAAATEGRRALAIDPTNPSVLQVLGVLSNALGRWDDAEQAFRLALTRDPLNPYVLWGLGATYYGAGRLAESESTFRRLLEVAPGFIWTRAYLSRTLLGLGKPEAALAMAQQEADEGFRLMALPVMLQAVGRQAEADEALKAQIEYWGDIDAYAVAMTYAYRGDHDRALHWLERAYEQKSSGIIEILAQPLFRDDPHYRDFLRKMKLIE